MTRPHPISEPRTASDAFEPTGPRAIGQWPIATTVIEMDNIEPPPDPNDWTDEQWLDWLKATDDDQSDEDEEAISSVVSRVVHSTPGQVLGQAMLGMAQAIYGHQDEDLVIVVEGNDKNRDDEPFAVHLDPDHPELSTVTFKPESS